MFLKRLIMWYGFNRGSVGGRGGRGDVGVVGWWFVGERSEPGPLSWKGLLAKGGWDGSSWRDGAGANLDGNEDLRIPLMAPLLGKGGGPGDARPPTSEGRLPG